MNYMEVLLSYIDVLNKALTSESKDVPDPLSMEEWWQLIAAQGYTPYDVIHLLAGRETAKAEAKLLQGTLDEANRQWKEITLEAKRQLGEAQEKIAWLEKRLISETKELLSLRNSKSTWHYIALEGDPKVTGPSGWSYEYYQLAYRVEGCPYHGLQTVSRYQRDFGWEYMGKTGGLKQWGYEAYAWKELEEGPNG